ncbi:MAG: hypothetical protein ACSLFP_03905 [Acidimicrobiales bacterium]
MSEGVPVSHDLDDQGPPRRARRLVVVTLVLLMVPGLIGFEAWPMSAWRLFSLSRSDRQTRWVLDTVGDDGEARRVSLEELPLRYRHAEWPMAELPSADDPQREDLCQALAAAVVDVHPETRSLRIVRDRQRLVEVDDEWVVESAPELIHECGVDAP